jgi:hypothetical protein
MAWLNSAECGSSGLKISMSSSLSYIGAFSAKDSCDTYNEINRRSRVGKNLIVVTEKYHFISREMYSVISN